MSEFEVWLRMRCTTCGHRLAFDASSCPQCNARFDGQPDPKVWPETCVCARCTAGRVTHVEINTTVKADDGTDDT
jgi:hypothetical protein